MKFYNKLTTVLLYWSMDSDYVCGSCGTPLVSQRPLTTTVLVNGIYNIFIKNSKLFAHKKATSRRIQ